MSRFSGMTSIGELGLVEKTGGRFLSMAVFARWHSSRIPHPLSSTDK